MKTQSITNSSPLDAPLELDASGDICCDVLVVGAGIGGLGAAIYLRQLGFQVICVEPEPFPHARVGESLDWSTPALLADLGLSRDQFITAQIATHKNKIRLVQVGEPPYQTTLPDWLGRKPFGFETMTIHVDRSEFDQILFERAQQIGVQFIWTRVTGVETTGQRITACQLDMGKRVTAKRYIDASGQAGLFAKAFAIPKIEYGKRKVSAWAYFDHPPHLTGTTFYTGPHTKYLNWIWEIPIRSDCTSVGFTLPAEHLKDLRRDRKSIAQVLRDEFAKHAQLNQYMSQQPDFHVSTCSFRSFVSQSSCGPNWFMVGEAAATPDPLTSNGVTSALRHARSAARLIQRYANHTQVPLRARRFYHASVRCLGRVYNHSIETVVYDWPVRMGLGLVAALRIYTLFGYMFNALYSKFDPQSRFVVALFELLSIAVWVWVKSWALIGKSVYRLRGTWAWLLNTKVPRPHPG